jgi:phosphinothricin acetyltransferase
MNDDRIRIATLGDAAAITRIYQPYILNTAITFEYDPVSVEEMQRRMEMVQEHFPWLVYEKEGKVVGYAYCSKFKERAAFQWDCECSVYIDEDYHRQGIATALYDKLFDLIQKQGYYTIYALITNSHNSSISLHKKFGFHETAVYEKTGYKMGKWWDLLVMEKRLRSFDAVPEDTKSIHKII